MVNKLFFYNLMLLTTFSSAQIDTIAFDIENKLLVFQGKINDQTIDFAFDTGASIGVANSNNVKKAKLEIVDNKKKVTDSNQENKLLSFVKVDKLAIGSFTFNNINDVYKDVAMLSCNNLYLLGQNVIKNLNWKIDFEKKLLYVSKNIFTPENESQLIPIKKYKNKRPHISLEIGGSKYDVLVDFGFTGVLEVNTKVKPILKQYEAQKKLGRGNSYLTSNMGLFGFGTPKSQLDCRLDKISLGKISVNDIPVSIVEDTDPKLGFEFFRSFSKSVILNYFEDKIFLTPSQISFSKNKAYDLKIYFVDQKFKIIAKNMNSNSSSSSFEIGEEVVSIDGKKAKDFIDECEYFNWFFFKKTPTIIVEKLNGKLYKIERAVD